MFGSLPAPAHPSSSITTLHGSDFEYVDSYKYISVCLDCKLSFQTHIKHIQSKIKSRIGFVFRNKASFTHAAKHTLVKLTIIPDPRIWLCNLPNILQHSTQQIGCSVSQCRLFCHQSPIYYPPLRLVRSRWLALPADSPNARSAGHLQDPSR